MLPRASSPTSNNTSASKKRKTAQDEADSNDPPPPPSPSTSYFFADGNVLLHVEMTLFKVHREVLEKAEVFADVLLVGADLGGEEAGGIPRIKLEDKQEDWEVFLRALYDGLSFSERLPTLSQTYSLLLLSDKYNHYRIFSGAKASFVARCKFEADHYQEHVNGNPYASDNKMSPSSWERTSRALLAWQERFELERSSVRGIYNHLALSTPPERCEFLRDFNPAEYPRLRVPEWFPMAVSKEIRHSLLLRVEAFALLSFRAFNDEGLHFQGCKLPSCHDALAAFRKKILHHAAVAPSLLNFTYADSLYLAIKTLDEGNDKDVLNLEGYCAQEILEFWKNMRSELQEEMEKDF